MNLASDIVQVEIVDRVGVATLNRPDKFNCLSSDVFRALGGALDRFEGDSNVRVILIRAAGKHFCTGADLDEVMAVRQSDPSLRAFIDGGHLVLRRLEQSLLPVVVAQQGLALAGGLELVMAADVVIAAQSAKLGDQHGQYGLVPGWGGTQRLARLVGLRRALHLMFTAKWLTAEEALAWGLINQIVDDAALEVTAIAYAAAIATRNPEGLAAMKSLTRRGLDLSIDDGLALEAAEICSVLQSTNVNEGLDAFQNRRKPVFN